MSIDTVPRLAGCIAPLVTPFTADDRVDEPRFASLVQFLLDGGASALMPTALTGEGPLLQVDEIAQVWEAAFDAAAGRVPIVPAVITTRTVDAVRLARLAHGLGAAAVMVAPVVPELYAGRSRHDVVGFYEAVADATPLPVVLFNYPSLTGVDFTPEFIAELAAIDRIQYVKESTADSRRVHGIQRRLGDRIEVICGNPNAALESLALGCRAWITGIMNVVPRSARQLMDAVHVDADLVRARRIYYDGLLPLVDLMFRNSNPTGTIKAGLRARGVSVGVPRQPGSDVSTADAAALAAFAARVDAFERRAYAAD